MDLSLDMLHQISIIKKYHIMQYTFIPYNILLYPLWFKLSNNTYFKGMLPQKQFVEEIFLGNIHDMFRSKSIGWYMEYCQAQLKLEVQLQFR